MPVSDPIPLPCHHVAGDPADCGRELGRQLGELVDAFHQQRLRAARVYCYERGLRDGDRRLLDLGCACLDALAVWDAAGHAEHCALAEAVGIDAAALYATTQMTDVRDILLLGEAPADEEGCTAVLIPTAHSADGDLIAAQTWDLNPGDLDFVVGVHRQPRHGPETWAITCAGSQTIMGMNAHGLAVGTTNIKARGSRIGIGYISILHRMIACESLADASAVVEGAPRAGAHTYWAADPADILQWECSAADCHRRTVATEPFVATNHCQIQSTIAIEGEIPTASSKARLARATDLATATRLDVTGVRNLFADRHDGVDSINRYAEDEQGTATNACMIAVPARRELHACKGPADRGDWVRLPFAG